MVHVMNDNKDLDRARRVLPRRAALALGGTIGIGGLIAACGSSSSEAPDVEGGSSPTSVDGGNLSDGAEIPSETQGPFPADGSNGPNVLSNPDVVRRNLTTSFAGMNGTAEGVPTSIELTLVDADTGAALVGAAVYLWHCTADGRYSVYEVTEQNYLRGIQVSDESGRLRFDTVFPGCYGGRWPHCHFEIFDSLGDAAAGGPARKTTQLALPEAECRLVYEDGRYGNSASNLDRLSLSSDMVFRDGWSDQLADVTGDNESGYTVTLTVRT